LSLRYFKATVDDRRSRVFSSSGFEAGRRIKDMEAFDCLKGKILKYYTRHECDGILGAQVSGTGPLPQRIVKTQGDRTDATVADAVTVDGDNR